MRNKVEDYIHKGNKNFGQVHPNDQNNCQFSVWESGRGAFNHQCSRKAIEQVDGVGFCKTHAQEVRKGLGIKSDFVIRYAASFKDKPILVEIEVIKETDATITIQGVKELVGSSYEIYVGTLKKDSQYLRPYRFFNNRKDAILWLYETAKNVQKNEVEILNKLLRTIQEIEILVDSLE